MSFVCLVVCHAGDSSDVTLAFEYAHVIPPLSREDNTDTDDTDDTYDIDDSDDAEDTDNTDDTDDTDDRETQKLKLLQNSRTQIWIKKSICIKKIVINNFRLQQRMRCTPVFRE